MRRVISAMQISVDGSIEDPEAKQDWVENWEDDYGLLDEVDTCVLGSVTYPGYEEYWTAVLEDPEASAFEREAGDAQGDRVCDVGVQHAPHRRLSQADGCCVE